MNPVMVIIFILDYLLIFIDYFNDLDNEDKQRVIDAMELISNETCVRFVTKNETHIEHIKFLKVSLNNNKMCNNPPILSKLNT